MSDGDASAFTAMQWAALGRGEPLRFRMTDGVDVVAQRERIELHCEVRVELGTALLPDVRRCVVYELSDAEERDLLRLAAVLLNKLREDHPLKVTRRDVDNLSTLLDRIVPDRDAILPISVRSLVPKLDALVPPHANP